ncbi:MAG: hypothetical protein WA733_03675 [Methylocystis sp.]
MSHLFVHLTGSLERAYSLCYCLREDEAQRKGKFCVASLKEARDKLEATARRIRTEWVQA